MAASSPTALPSPLNQVCAGIAAGSVTAAIMSPLDVARTWLQMQSVILPPPSLRATSPFQALSIIRRVEGVRGWYRGYAPAAVALPLFWAAYFPVYSGVKHMLEATTSGSAAAAAAAAARTSTSPAVTTPQPPSLQAAAAQATAAVIAAVACDTLTSPFWVVRTRLQTQAIHIAARTSTALLQYKGMTHAFKAIVHTEGWRALYKGLLASWMCSMHVALQFPLYEYLRYAACKRAARLRPSDADDRWAAHMSRTLNNETADVLAAMSTLELLDPSTSVPAPELVGSFFAHSSPASAAVSVSLETAGAAQAGAFSLLMASAASKLIASSVTYPLEIARARLQDQRNFAARQFTGVWDCLRTTYANEGARGLYAGFSVNVMRAVPACAITFVTYEAVLSELQSRGAVAVHEA